MISTEMLIVMLVFLAYIGVWYVYMNDFMKAVDGAVARLESNTYADYMQHKVNMLCANSGSASVSFKNAVSISGSGREISVNGMVREVDCDVDVKAGTKTKNARLRKDDESRTVIIE
ncbi:MAG: hypothetical protein N3G76_02045 [Candidatus Micrarchaeota archaeon]|nr:hypothetical protein [Candidatus Micrarchaeota archaeon]